MTSQLSNCNYALNMEPVVSNKAMLDIKELVALCLCIAFPKQKSKRKENVIVSNVSCKC